MNRSNSRRLWVLRGSLAGLGLAAAVGCSGEKSDAPAGPPTGSTPTASATQPMLDIGGTPVSGAGGASGGGVNPLDLETGFAMADIGSMKLGDLLDANTVLPVTTQNGMGCGSTLLAIVRDFDDTHPDFEHYTGSGLQGIVESALGADQKPVYAHTGSTEFTTSPADFAQWYHHTEGVNKGYLLKLRLAKNGDRFSFESRAFFPLDGAGLGNQGREHNFHFTTELHTEFVYHGGENFEFIGDDDLWVFINNRLAIDLGGLHPRQQKQISLDAEAVRLGIEKGKSYHLDLFHAERHTDASNFRVDTSLQFTNCGTVSDVLR